MQAFKYDPPTDPLVIVHEDDDLILVSKPSGLLSVPGKDPMHSDCVAVRLKALHPNALLVHRLDMDTSGIMVFAANSAAQRHLGLQFERRHLEKTYEALVWGRPAAVGFVDLPLIADWPNRPLQKVCFEMGKLAETHWKVLEQTEIYARVELMPKTGRSHQLRVHMKEMGHPILGDRFYATPEALLASSRLCLHAKELRLRHPSGGGWVNFKEQAPF